MCQAMKNPTHGCVRVGSCICECMCKYVQTRVGVCVCVYACVQAFVGVCWGMHAEMRVCVYACVQACVGVCWLCACECMCKHVQTRVGV